MTPATKPNKIGNTNAALVAFTVAEIASALGRKRSSVKDILACVPASGAKIVSGNEARTWTVEALPSSLRIALDALAKKLRCVDAETALRQCAAPWSPEDRKSVV